MTYINFSKSERAVEAENSGLMTATKASKWLAKYGIKDVTTDILEKTVRKAEWHHTGKCYNRTNYYCPFVLFENRKKIKAAISDKVIKQQVVPKLMKVTWTEWEGYGRYKYACDHEFVGEVIFKGSWAYFNGLKKKINGNHIFFEKI